MLKSLELNWIRRVSDKTCPVPEVVYVDTELAGGSYVYPIDYSGIIQRSDDGAPIHRNGLIEVSTAFGDDFARATLAHEWRHCMQYHRGLLNGPSYHFDFPRLDYDDALRLYLTQNERELDAFRFQFKHAGIDESQIECIFDLVNVF